MGAIAFIRRHWRGEFSLARSFWIDMVVLRIVLVAVEHFLFKIPFSPDVGIALIVAYFIVAHVIVYLWQTVGVLRSLDCHQGAYGSITVFWGVLFGIVAGLILTVSSVFVSAQSVFVAYRSPQEVVTEQPVAYSLNITENGRHVTLSGEIQLGITNDLEALTAAHPHIRLLILESAGGNTFAARGLARVIRQLGLDTHVESTCFSACTIAFIAGRNRSIGKAGRLGFHQYGIDALHRVPFAEPLREQARDLSRFRQQGIAEAFLGRIFERAPGDMWHPTRQQLLDAGVITP